MPKTGMVNNNVTDNPGDNQNNTHEIKLKAHMIM